jgi:hypothetical protein
MKTVLLTTAAILAASFASAEGLHFGATTVAEHKVDAEQTTLVATPEIGYVFAGFDLTADIALSVYDNEFVADTALDDPVFNFRLDKMLMENLELYGETSYDWSAEKRGEITIGAEFSF